MTPQSDARDLSDHVQVGTERRIRTFCAYLDFPATRKALVATVFLLAEATQIHASGR